MILRNFWFPCVIHLSKSAFLHPSRDRKKTQLLNYGSKRIAFVFILYFNSSTTLNIINKSLNYKCFEWSISKGNVESSCEGSLYARITLKEHNLTKLLGYFYYSFWIIILDCSLGTENYSSHDLEMNGRHFETELKQRFFLVNVTFTYTKQAENYDSEQNLYPNNKLC